MQCTINEHLVAVNGASDALLWHYNVHNRYRPSNDDRCAVLLDVGGGLGGLVLIVFVSADVSSDMFDNVKIIELY
jgi:hypothetical protein